MNPEDLPPSEFVLARYDDIYSPCGGIEEYIGGWVIWSWADYQDWLRWVHSLTYPVQLKVGQFAALTYNTNQALLGGIRCENLTADEAAVLRKFFRTGYGDFPDEEIEDSLEEAADSAAGT